MEYGTGAIFGCPAHDQRDLDFARKYGAAGAAGGAAAGRRTRPDFAIGDAGLCRPGHACSTPASSTAWTSDAAKRRGDRASWSELGVGAGRGELAAARLGRVRGSATGAARSRSSIARPAAWCRCRTRDLPVRLPEDVTFDRPGNPLDHHPTWKHVACPACGAAGAARDRHVRHLRRQFLVFRAVLQPAGGRAGDARGGRSLDAGRPVYRRHRARDPASAVCPLLHPRDAPHRPCRRSTSRSPACSPRAW